MAVSSDTYLLAGEIFATMKVTLLQWHRLIYDCKLPKPPPSSLSLSTVARHLRGRSSSQVLAARTH